MQENEQIADNEYDKEIQNEREHEEIKDNENDNEQIQNEENPNINGKMTKKQRKIKDKGDNNKNIQQILNNINKYIQPQNQPNAQQNEVEDNKIQIKDKKAIQTNRNMKMDMKMKKSKKEKKIQRKNIMKLGIIMSKKK